MDTARQNGTQHNLHHKNKDHCPPQNDQLTKTPGDKMVWHMIVAMWSCVNASICFACPRCVCVLHLSLLHTRQEHRSQNITDNKTSKNTRVTRDKHKHMWKRERKRTRLCWVCTRVNGIRAWWWSKQQFPTSTTTTLVFGPSPTGTVCLTPWLQTDTSTHSTNPRIKFLVARDPNEHLTLWSHSANHSTQRLQLFGLANRVHPHKLQTRQRQYSFVC